MLAASGGGRLHVLRAPARADIQRVLQQDPLVDREDRRPIAACTHSPSVADSTKPPLHNLRPVLVEDVPV